MRIKCSISIVVFFLFLLYDISGQKTVKTDLFNSGTNGVHTYRIPAMEVSIKGTVIAICDARRDKGGDLPGNIDLVMRRSFDHGESWEDTRYILDLPEGHGCGDPSLLVDRITGRIFCFYAYGPPGVGILTSKPGSNTADDMTTQHAQYIYSNDDGNTWSSPVELNPQIKDPAWEGLFATSGIGIQTISGRLIQPFVIKYDIKKDGSFQTQARNAYSDDHGLTWRMGEIAGYQIGESKVIELVDGSIMQNMRTRSLNYRSVAVSTTGGKSFDPMWQDTILIDPRCNAGLTRYSSVWEGQPYNIIAFSNPSDLKERKNMTVRLSLDEGKSWPISLPVYGGPSAYSTVMRLYDGSLGLFFENGDKSSYEKITFVKFKKEFLDSVLSRHAEEKQIEKRLPYSAYYYHRSHQFWGLPDTEKEIVFLGNSISDGAEWHELLGNSKFKNRGISSDNSEGVLNRLNAITKLKPAAIFLMIGVNDLAKGVLVKQLVENHEKIYEKIRYDSPDTKLFVLSILPVSDRFIQFKSHNTKTELIIEANQELKKMALEMGHTYIDLFSMMSDRHNKLRNDITEDGVHLNGRGYQVWVNAIKKYLLLFP